MARICYYLAYPYLKNPEKTTIWDFIPEKWHKLRPKDKEEDLGMSQDDIETTISKFVYPLLEMAEKEGPYRG